LRTLGLSAPNRSFRLPYRPINHSQNPTQHHNKSPKNAHIVPPPPSPREPTHHHPQKHQISIPPKNILFTNQRKNPIFPQKTKPHLATHFSVYLRQHPFSEFSPKKPKSLKIFPILIQLTPSNHSSRSYLRDHTLIFNLATI
jgi:hypothetical protein